MLTSTFCRKECSFCLTFKFKSLSKLSGPSHWRILCTLFCISNSILTISWTRIFTWTGISIPSAILRCYDNKGFWEKNYFAWVGWGLNHLFAIDIHFFPLSVSILASKWWKCVISCFPSFLLLQVISAQPSFSRKPGKRTEVVGTVRPSTKESVNVRWPPILSHVYRGSQSECFNRCSIRQRFES